MYVYTSILSVFLYSFPFSRFWQMGWFGALVRSQKPIKPEASKWHHQADGLGFRV